MRHTLWRVGGADRDALVAAFGRIPALYIADGHHRAASAARARDAFRERGATRTSLGDGADYSDFLAVAFPARSGADPCRTTGSSRTSAGLTPDAFLAGGARTVRRRDRTGRRPRRRGEISMYFGGSWHTLRAARRRRRRLTPSRRSTSACCRISCWRRCWGSRDVTHRQADRFRRRRSRHRRARDARRLRQGRASRFRCIPVSVADLMAVSDAGAIMPPKSTWFEPKLRDGLLDVTARYERQR